MTRGILYGIGVGPGDPDLLTVKAAKVLARVRDVFAAASSRNEFSYALECARPHLSPDARTRELPFPMLREGPELERAWHDNARAIAETVAQAGEAAFLTLGDPLIYSTFGYLMRALEKDHPEIEIRVVPGVTSFQAAAALTRTVLCEREENLLILSGIAGRDGLKAALGRADNAVILKAYRNYAAIREALRETGREAGSLFVSRLGRPDETAAPMEKAPENPPYLSLVLVK